MAIFVQVTFCKLSSLTSFVIFGNKIVKDERKHHGTVEES